MWIDQGSTIQTIGGNKAFKMKTYVSFYMKPPYPIIFPRRIMSIIYEITAVFINRATDNF